jgi:hypothetical protein
MFTSQPSALDQPIAITFFPDFAARTKKVEHHSMRSLAPRIQTTNANEKGQLPWLKAATFGDLRSDKDCLRNDANVLSVSGCEADYDAGKMPFGEASDRLEQQGIAALAYASPPHAEAAPRWRIICPFSAPLPPERRAKMLGRLNGLFGGVFSGESFTLSQSYYFGSVQNNPSHRVELTDGLPLDQHDDLDEIWIGRTAGGSKEHASEEAREDAELIRCVVTGEHLHVELVALAARYIARGIPHQTTISLLQGLMLSQPDAARDERWSDRFEDIGRTVASAVGKFHGKTRKDRKAVARLALTLIARRRPDNEVRWHVQREAESAGFTPVDAENIIRWARRQEVVVMDKRREPA